MTNTKKCGKCKKFKRLCECGRPETITPQVEAKLQEALGLGMPVVKAIAYAGVTHAAYYRKFSDDDEFRSKMRSAQNEMSIIARKSVKIGIARTPALALAYLDRKEKDEFSTKSTLEHEGNIGIKLSDEARKRLAKYKRSPSQGSV